MSGVLRYKDPSTGQWVDVAWPAHSHPGMGRVVGEVIAYAGPLPPSGWLVCDGSTFDQATYPDLAAALGRNVLPDLRGRSIIGLGGATAPDLWDTAGAATHGHVGNPLPTHDHATAQQSTSSDTHNHSVDIGAFTSGSAGSHSHSTGAASSSTPLALQTDEYLRVPQSGHTHSVGSGGSHTHSVNPPATGSSNDTHGHTYTPNVSPASGGTPTVQAGSSYHPVLSLQYLIYAG